MRAPLSSGFSISWLTPTEVRFPAEVVVLALVRPPSSSKRGFGSALAVVTPAVASSTERRPASSAGLLASTKDTNCSIVNDGAGLSALVEDIDSTSPRPSKHLPAHCAARQLNECGV